MKGISLPINAVIIIVIAALVLLVLSVFFLSGTGTSINKINARQVFESKCPNYKCNFDNSAAIVRDADFVDACKTLYGNIDDNMCLAYCNCGLEVDPCKLDCDICASSVDSKECKRLVELKRFNCKC